MFNLDQYEYFEDVNLGLTKYTPKKKFILDVGCGQGMLGEYYRQQGNVVWGIDWSKDTISINQKRLDTYINLDITNFAKVRKALGKQKFDVVVFADVLEHIYDPVGTVKFYLDFLTPNGKVYISVPNWVVFYTRLQFLFGNFNYWLAGTQEKTHIRIFTENNLKRLIRESGLELETLDITPGIARWVQHMLRDRFTQSYDKFDRQAIMKSRSYKFYNNYLYTPEYWICRLIPGLLAYQYIAIAKSKSHSLEKK
jgi:2-polyprenyl-3-methyl-5-hydroxy-6-metoxy-1,4-benzoquinol methylase